MKLFLDATFAIQEAIDIAVAPTTPAEEETGLPEGVEDVLAALRLLEGVPFQYLVPDDDLLPPESIRFFYLDRNWSDALVNGALAAGAFSTLDRAQLQARYAEIRGAVDVAERNRWAVRTDLPGFDGSAEVATGFLLRSRAVSGWPGLHVRAYQGASDEPTRMLRIERLAPAVLLALIDGVPDRIVIEEPRQGIQFGVDADDAEGNGPFRANVRDPDTGEFVNETAKVPLRRGAPGVIDMEELRRRLVATGQVGGDLSSAEYALQMLQLPYQQWFGDQQATFSQFLQAKVTLATVRTWTLD
jgi:hypothetical protein